MSSEQIRSAVGVVAMAMVASCGLADEIFVSGGESINDAVGGAQPGDVVIVAPGTYIETVQINVPYVSVRSVAGPELTEIRAPLNEGGLGVVEMFAGSRLEGFTVVGASDLQSTQFDAAVYVDSGGGSGEDGAIIRDCQIQAAVGSAFLTGIVVENSSSVRVFDSLITDFRGQTSMDGFGGGPEGAGVSAMFGSRSEFVRCAFQRNSVPFGGGAFWMISGAASFVDCSFSENSVGSGGGAIYVDVSNLSPQITGGVSMVGCVFDRNSAQDAVNSPSDSAAGAAVVLTGARSVEVIGCSFTGNELLEDELNLAAGAVLIDAGGGSGGVATARVLNNVFDGNRAVNGPGAVFVSQMASEFAGNLVVGNTAGDAFSSSLSAAVLLLDPGFGLASSVVNNTFADNESIAPFGAPQPAYTALDVEFDGGVIANNILRGSQGAGGFAQLLRVSGDPVVAFNNIEGLNQTPFSDPGSGNIDADPLFLDGANGVFALASGSPSIDAGSNARLPEDASDIDGDLDPFELLPVDLVGGPRIQDGAATRALVVDQGAIEFGFGPAPASCAAADVAPPFGELNLADVQDFLISFAEGCPD